LKVYPTGKIRNMALISHGGAGKTSLAEAMLFDAGHITRLGKVEDGTTTSDYQPEAVKRRMTINATLLPVEWKEHKINLIDTPGFAEFSAEVKAAMRVADSLCMVVCGVAGVEVQTEVYWEEADARNIPRIAFINKLDRENSNFSRVLEQMHTAFGHRAVPVQLPIGSESSFCGIVDLLHMKAFKWDASGKFAETPIPSDMADEAQAARDQLVEAASEGDDDLLAKYLDGEELTPAEVYSGLKSAIIKGSLIPVLCGSAAKNIGIQALLDFIVESLPSPADVLAAEGRDLVAEPLAALVYKTLADPYVGKLTFFRLFSGSMKSDSLVFNAQKEKDEKISQILIMRGKTQDTVTELAAGDIAAVAKLTETATGDTLTRKDKPIVLDGIDFPEPLFSVAIEPKSKGDEDKLGTAINRLIDEDPTLRWSKNAETKQTLLTGMGESHLDIILERLQKKFGVEVNVKEPSVPYREAIRSTVKVEGKHKKQTGGHGQYGHVWLEVGPSYDAEFEFTESLFGGSVPKSYVPAVEKGVREGLQEGVLAGYPVRGVKVNLYDGSYHTVDSNELSFKLAAIMAFRKGLEQAKPVLLEPIATVEVTVPDQFTGDIMGDLTSKRGRILGIEPKGKYQVIKATVPAAEMQKYAIDLKSITQGRGSFRLEITGYEELPANMAEKVIAAKKAEKNE